MPPANTPERFWNRMDKSGDCWLWTGSTINTGYGDTQYQGVHWTTHRLAWVLTHGPIAADLFVLHKCDVRRCGNPDHLFLGTQADNLRDMVGKGRYGVRRLPRGEKHGNAKLRNCDIPVIRQAHANGDTQTALAIRFGVDRRAIFNVVRHLGWKDVA